MQKATPEDVAATVPPEYLLGDRELYLDAFERVRPIYSHDGLISPRPWKMSYQVLLKHNYAVRRAPVLFLNETYTNVFVQNALKKYSRAGARRETSEDDDLAGEGALERGAGAPPGGDATAEARMALDRAGDNTLSPRGRGQGRGEKQMAVLTGRNVATRSAMTTPALSLDNVTCTFPARGDRGTYTAIKASP